MLLPAGPIASGLGWLSGDVLQSNDTSHPPSDKPHVLNRRLLADESRNALAKPFSVAQADDVPLAASRFVNHSAHRFVSRLVVRESQSLACPNHIV
jgi:hypothetical protein